MIYLALGDSISIDDYTGVPGGGAASQLARLLNVEQFVNRTRDGNTTSGVLSDLEFLDVIPELVTITAGGNDFLQAVVAREGGGTSPFVQDPLRNLNAIAERLRRMGSTVIMNTVYDPTDGDDGLGDSLGIHPSLRGHFNELNDGIRSLAHRSGFILSDLESFFRGHGINALDSWIVGGIEPNLAGATAIAHHWHGLLVRT